MKILYYTQTSFLDCDLPLIKTLIEQNHEVYLFFELLPYHLKSTIVDIKQQLPKVEILPLSAYDEFSHFNKFVDSTKTYILNRACKIWNWKNVKLRIEFLKLIEEINPDVIHCTGFPDLSDLFLYRYRHKIVQIVHDPFIHSGEGSFRTHFKRWISYKLTQCFVLLNEKQQASFITKNKLQKTKVYINKLGTYDYLNIYRKTSKNQNPIILFWGRISPYKGVEYLLAAMEKIHVQFPEAVLILAGSGNLYFDYTPYRNKNYIKLINRYISMEELGEMLSSATVVVCPYTDATQSGVVMSAYTYQIPVVATNVGGLPEMVDNKKTGFLVPPKDSEALANAVISLLSSKELLNSFKENIYQLYHKGIFSWKNIAIQYLNIYNSLLKRSKND